MPGVIRMRTRVHCRQLNRSAIRSASSISADREVVDDEQPVLHDGPVLVGDGDLRNRSGSYSRAIATPSLKSSRQPGRPRTARAKPRNTTASASGDITKKSALVGFAVGEVDGGLRPPQDVSELAGLLLDGTCVRQDNPSVNSGSPIDSDKQPLLRCQLRRLAHPRLRHDAPSFGRPSPIASDRFVASCGAQLAQLLETRSTHAGWNRSKRGCYTATSAGQCACAVAPGRRRAARRPPAAPVPSSLSRGDVTVDRPCAGPHVPLVGGTQIARGL